MLTLVAHWPISSIRRALLDDTCGRWPRRRRPGRPPSAASLRVVFVLASAIVLRAVAIALLPLAVLHRTGGRKCRMRSKTRSS
jgi:hypothetical protein